MQVNRSLIKIQKVTEKMKPVLKIAKGERAD